MIRNLNVTAAVMMVALTSACVDDPVEVDTSAETPVADDTVFHVVSIDVAADGTIATSEPRPITAGEQRARAAMKRAVARGDTVSQFIERDPYCDNTSFWLFDRTDYTGNMICFAGYGWTDLAHYWRYVAVANQYARWMIARGSFMAGTRSGELLTSHSVQSREVCGWNGAFFVPCQHLRPQCFGPAYMCTYDFAPYEERSFDMTKEWQTVSHDW